MKSIISFVAVALSVSSASAFVPQPAVAPMRAAGPLMAKLDMTPELEAAIAEVREAASAFSEETAHFANGTLVFYYSWFIISPQINRHFCFSSHTFTIIFHNTFATLNINCKLQ